MPNEEEIELREKQAIHDDGQPWGHLTDDGVWHELPKKPLLLADLGPPPFTVKLPSGERRAVVHRPQ